MHVVIFNAYTHRNPKFKIDVKQNYVHYIELVLPLFSRYYFLYHVAIASSTELGKERCLVHTVCTCVRSYKKSGTSVYCIRINYK